MSLQPQDARPALRLGHRHQSGHLGEIQPPRQVRRQAPLFRLETALELQP